MEDHRGFESQYYSLHDAKATEQDNSVGNVGGIVSQLDINLRWHHRR